jgi:hypothetical protein
MMGEWKQLELGGRRKIKKADESALILRFAEFHHASLKVQQIFPQTNEVAFLNFSPHDRAAFVP